MSLAGALRRELTIRKQQMAVINGSAHEPNAGEAHSVIFGPNERRQHGNFNPTSYRNISANPDWIRRLAKVHPGSRRALPRADCRWMQLDCANSSDAFLMNIFCYRCTVERGPLTYRKNKNPFFKRTTNPYDEMDPLRSRAKRAGRSWGSSHPGLHRNDLSCFRISWLTKPTGKCR